MAPPRSRSAHQGTVDRLDYPTSRTKQHSADDEEAEGDESDHDDRNGPSAPLICVFGRTPEDAAPSFFETVASGIQDADRARKTRALRAYLSFVWALVACLGAGSITAFSLYAPLFQRRLGYTQFRVNGISIAAEIAMYLPVPLSGYLCDRYGPGWPSVGSGVLFGIGYLLAAFTYKSGRITEGGWPFGVMVLAFVLVGAATSSMYLSAVSTCAKNFGRGKHKGLALALPIAAFGLSGMWQSQVGSRLLYEKKPDGSRGSVDVHRYFLFLGIMLLCIGVVGGFALQVVGEEEMIDEAVEELERSGLLDDSELFHRVVQERGYGTLHDNNHLSPEQRDQVVAEMDDRKAQLERDQEKKTWLLNEETRRFLADRTMWLLAAGFFLITGPGEAFINNLGTIIDTLVPPGTPEELIPTDAATHVSIVAITSTLARIFTGTLTDLLAPTAPLHQHRRGPNSVVNSVASLRGEGPGDASSGPPMFASFRGADGRIAVPRPVFLIAFGLILSAGQVVLALGAVQNHAERFWIVSAAQGAGYGAVFSLVPIIISVVWGVENFGTNWGIVATVPAAGATVWGLVYSAVYQAAAGSEDGNGAGDLLCHGTACYAPTMWAMAVSVWIACAAWFWAWRGPGGWYKRGIAV